MGPKGRDIFLFFYITICLSIALGVLGLKLNVNNIKQNWAVNRCNPIYMPFADNIETNFAYCVQTSIKNFAPFILEPLHALTKSLGSIASSNMFSINALRISHANFRGMMGINFSAILDSITNVTIDFQKNSLVIQDIIGKIVGVAFSIMYIIQSSIYTFQSTWNGPPGQVIQGLGKLCFHPNTLIEANSKLKFMKHCSKGDVLQNGSVVVKKLIFYNVFREPFYCLNNTYVTPYHKVFSHAQNKFIYVFEHEDSFLAEDIYSEWLVCFITSDHRICIDGIEFMDWEDDDV
jgi:hypothetical protein